MANNNLLVFDNAGTDPYTSGDFDLLLDENQATVDSRIGNANYDIGHVFCTTGGGLAQTPSVGITGFKAQDASGLPQPTGEFFVSNYVAHEVGHQFGADHTFNANDPNRLASSAYEPGSGSTIMSYAGVISPAEDLQASGDPYFRHHSFEQIIEYVDVTRPTVGSRTSTSNSPTKFIKVTPTNDAPVIGAFEGAVSYLAGSPALVLDTDATVADADSANMDGGKLTLALTVNRQTTDVLTIRNEGVTAGKIGVNGASITYGGVVIGVMAGGTGTTPLTVTFNAGATPAAVQALIRNLTFRSTAAAPSTLMRTVSLKLEDGDGGISSLLTKNINVTLV